MYDLTCYVGPPYIGQGKETGSTEDIQLSPVAYFLFNFRSIEAILRNGIVLNKFTESLHKERPLYFLLNIHPSLSAFKARRSL